MIINGVEYEQSVKKDESKSVGTADSNVSNTDNRHFDDLVGKTYFFRTVTYHTVGRVVSIYNNFVKLESASFIPDTPRFMNFIKDGNLDEVEPVGTCWVNIDSVTDFFPWSHDLPTKQN